MDNRHLSPAQLTVLRRKIVEAVIKQKQKQVVAARLFGISIRSVHRYIHAYKEKGTASLTYKRRGLRKGYNNLMTEEMENLVKEVIETRTPEQVHCNMVCAVSCQGTLRWMVFLKSFTIDVFIEFLRRLLYKAKKKIFLIMDNHKVHHAKKNSSMAREA
jgi:transposase